MDEKEKSRNRLKDKVSKDEKIKKMTYPMRLRCYPSSVNLLVAAELKFLLVLFKIFNKNTIYCV